MLISQESKTENNWRWLAKELHGLHLSYLFVLYYRTIHYDFVFCLISDIGVGRGRLSKFLFNLTSD